jgi:hypothetical protein
MDGGIMRPRTFEIIKSGKYIATRDIWGWALWWVSTAVVPVVDISTQNTYINTRRVREIK